MALVLPIVRSSGSERSVPAATSPGWYPDPDGSPRRRWWDGERWTEHTSD